KFGIMAGAYLTAMFSDRVGIQPELVFSSMGSKDEDEGKYKLNYIALPVLVRIQIIDQLHFLVGPQASFLMSANYEYESEEEDIKDFVKGLDFGAVFGVGADISRFNVGVRYGLGLSNISDM